MKNRLMPHRLFVVLVVLLATFLIVACYEPQPMYAPPPPAPRALSVTPQRKQSKSQQGRDSADCQSMASGQATSSESWAQIFTACMGGRGYLVQ
jgi:uncharacterized lipoprotein YajG